MVGLVFAYRNGVLICLSLATLLPAFLLDDRGECVYAHFAPGSSCKLFIFFSF